MLLDVNGSKVCHHANPCQWTREYYWYCLRLLASALRNVDRPINVILGNIQHDFQNGYETVRLDIQSEHTLVQQGGRSVDEEVWGTIDLLDGSGKYLVRVPNFDYYSSLDGTIEYSQPNLANMKTNERFVEYLRSAVYVAPVIYDEPDFDSDHRDQTITMFSNNPCPRRAGFSKKAGGLGITNIQNVFSKEDLKDVYHRTKIMVNVHQTDHHHTLEELRLLPALCNGVVIVSEDVPLKHTVPYSDSIVWSSYDGLEYTVRRVQEHYDGVHKTIFTSELEDRIRSLYERNMKNVCEWLDKHTKRAIM